MSTQTNAPSMPGLAEASISQYRLLKQGTAARSVIHCTAAAADVPVGVSQQAGSTGDMITVRLPSAGTAKVTASVAITKGDKLYTAAAGKVTNVLATGRFVGVAMEAAAADGIVFEMLPSADVAAAFDVVDLAAQTSVAVATTPATVTTPYGYSQAQADAIVANLNAVIADFTDLRAKMVTAGLVKT